MRVRYYNLVHLKRGFLLLISICLLFSFLLGVHIFLSPRAFNHFIFRVRQPLRYIEFLRSGYRVQDIDCVLSARHRTFAYEDITRIPVDTQSIFFLETSCKHTAGVELSARQACSVESAAKMNPHKQVYVVVISSVMNATRSLVIQTLYEYENIKVVQVDLDRYFDGTVLRSFYKEDTILTSLWPLSHMSDLLRYVTLFKYGGTYLDLDFIITRSLEDLHNYAGAESLVAVAAGVIHMDKGHALARAALEELKAHFATTEWGANGPGVITRLLQRECGDQQYSQITTCANFTIYPPPYFYPIHWRAWPDYYNTSGASPIMSTLRASYAAHVWNSFTKSVPVELQSDQPYAQLARSYCPKITALAGDRF